MKKYILTFSLFTLIFLLAACSGEDASNAASENTNKKESDSETITYESENGPVEVPANPERVVVLATYTGNVMALDTNLVGVDTWSKQNPLWQEELADVEEVSEEDLEKIIELDPDLIIGLSTTKNIDKLSEIAPTVTFTYGAVDHLQQHIEIGKLLNKEEEATAWVEDFKERATEAGENIRKEIGEQTVSVIESFDKQLYVYGDNWGRGTEILYQEMGLNMPEPVQEVAGETGYYALSLEVLPEYAGDYIIHSKFDDGEDAFSGTETFKSLPAVKNGNVLEVNGHEFGFNDALSLDYQLERFTEFFLEK